MVSNSTARAEAGSSVDGVLVAGGETPSSNAADDRGGGDTMTAGLGPVLALGLNRLAGVAMWCGRLSL